MLVPINLDSSKVFLKVGLKRKHEYVENNEEKNGDTNKIIWEWEVTLNFVFLKIIFSKTLNQMNMRINQGVFLHAKHTLKLYECFDLIWDDN